MNVPYKQTKQVIKQVVLKSGRANLKNGITSIIQLLTNKRNKTHDRLSN